MHILLLIWNHYFKSVLITGFVWRRSSSSIWSRLVEKCHYSKLPPLRKPKTARYTMEVLGWEHHRSDSIRVYHNATFVWLWLIYGFAKKVKHYKHNKKLYSTRVKPGGKDIDNKQLLHHTFTKKKTSHLPCHDKKIEHLKLRHLKIRQKRTILCFTSFIFS